MVGPSGAEPAAVPSGLGPVRIVPVDDESRPVLLERPPAPRPRPSVLVVGVYLANRLNHADDVVRVIGSASECRVEQRWAALGAGPPSAALAAVTKSVGRGFRPKFAMLNALLADADLTRYDFVVLVDDDIGVPLGFLDALVAWQHHLGWALVQPARTARSFIDHPIVEQQAGVLARRTRFVESGPVVSIHRSAFPLVFPFDVTSSMGWGYEGVWSYRLEAAGLAMGIVDAVPVDHRLRRPVAYYDGGEANAGSQALLAREPHVRIEECLQVVDEVTAVPAIAARRPTKTRVIAFFLPQYHPIPENDRWWGEGFTDWTNVRRARPLFPGHHQPHVPAALGHYDLRDPAVLPRIERLAREHGVDGLCWYHYWFEGRRLLERPFDEMLARGDVELPFCVCWANESWSRRWDGGDQDVLQPQTYGPDDDRAHLRDLLPALRDPRAIAVDGRPLLLVYRVTELPDPAATAARWQDESRRCGLPGLHLVAVESGRTLGVDPRPLGFDATVRFQPDWSVLDRVPTLPVGPPTARVYDYPSLWPELARADPVPWIRYPTVCPGWDNTARWGDRAIALHDFSPREYERWLDRALEEAEGLPAEQRFVFVNGWNEWAEGCHLEPDDRSGDACLQATRRAVDRSHARLAGPAPAPASADPND